MPSKQFTFRHPKEVTHVYPDGTSERVRYGYFESIEYTHENGFEVGGTVTLAVPTIPVTELTKTDGTRVVTDKDHPFYYTNKRRDND